MRRKNYIFGTGFWGTMRGTKDAPRLSAYVRLCPLTQRVRRLLQGVVTSLIMPGSRVRVPPLLSRKSFDVHTLSGLRLFLRGPAPPPAPPRRSESAISAVFFRSVHVG